MRILAIESATTRGSVALLDGEQLVAEAAHEVASGHAETLVRLLDRLIEDAGWARSSVDLVAVGLGPGSFTGLRVGIALALGLGAGLGRPVRGVCSLRALACAARDTARDSGASWFGAVTDARRGEYCLALYDRDLIARVAPRHVAQLNVRSSLEELAGREPGILAGVLGQEAVPESVQVLPQLRAPAAQYVGLLAQSRWVEPEVLPLYLRDADAVLPNLVQNPLLPHVEAQR